MVVRCDKCQARYRIDDARAGTFGLTLKCGKCGNLFPATPVAKPADSGSAKPAAPAGALAEAAARGNPRDSRTPRPARPASAPAPDASAAASTGQEARRARVRPGRLILGIASGILGVGVMLAVVVAARKAGSGGPPEAAVRSLAQARSLAEQDAIALFPQAIEAARAAIAAAPRTPFGEAHAMAAEIEIAWADALGDLADGPRAKAHLDAALKAATAGTRADPGSSDLSIALADYYRASHARAEMGKELERAGALHADPARIAMVEGLALAQDGAHDTGTDAGGRAADRLRQAAHALPQSARVHYRLAQALAAQHNEMEALAELKETIRLSPTHERARAQLEAMATHGGGRTHDH
ncbi:MAG TPA: zinc-ribbon domain-containing protein [Myxococcales bacterium]|nr:zinc-ribbon domain-containing protein [Myxococcales bacterium]